MGNSSSFSQVYSLWAFCFLFGYCWSLFGHAAVSLGIVIVSLGIVIVSLDIAAASWTLPPPLGHAAACYEQHVND